MESKNLSHQIVRYTLGEFKTNVYEHKNSKGYNIRHKS